MEDQNRTHLSCKITYKLRNGGRVLHLRRADRVRRLPTYLPTQPTTNVTEAEIPRVRLFSKELSLLNKDGDPDNDTTNQQMLKRWWIFRREAGSSY